MDIKLNLFAIHLFWILYFNLFLWYIKSFTFSFLSNRFKNIEFYLNNKTNQIFNFILEKDQQIQNAWGNLDRLQNLEIKKTLRRRKRESPVAKSSRRKLLMLFRYWVLIRWNLTLKKCIFQNIWIWIEYFIHIIY